MSRLKRERGFTIAETLVTTFVMLLAVAGCWSVYLMGIDFYRNNLYHFNVQRHARIAADAMVYGYVGEGLVGATAITATTADSVTFNAGGTANCQIYLDYATWQIMYDDSSIAPFGFTPPYIQAVGGVAVTDFNVNPYPNPPPNAEGVVIDFTIQSFMPNTDPANHNPQDIRSSITLTTAVTGRSI